MKRIGLALLLIASASCDKGNVVTPSPVPTTTTTSVELTPVLMSHDARITRSSGAYHYISWKFTVDSPNYYSYAYVVARWFDAQGFQVEWTNWGGPLQQGIHEYTGETIIQKSIWAQVVRRTVTLESWYR